MNFETAFYNFDCIEIGNSSYNIWADGCIYRGEMARIYLKLLSLECLIEEVDSTLDRILAKRRGKSC